MLNEKKIIEFLDDLSAKTPTPGGGAMAGVCGAIAASLGIMVSKYSLKKKGLEDFQPIIEKSLENFLKCKERLIELAEEDMNAYQGIKDAFKSKDKEKINIAVRNGIETAYKIAKCGYEILNNSYNIAKYGNQNLLSDAIITGYYAWATLQSGLILVKDNIQYLSDEEYKKELIEDINEFTTETDGLVKKIRELFEEKNIKL
ncbi:hypothetical protein XO10_01175 [Marinitoga sp. 1135]|uniref:cyclodeaminase/cyclohydrolase family protein n=1 Tax=Marinitoga sp. 1135 TaxID=1643333 RepID=UPI001586E74A|nr:cyclodeaminase/cyclohydrolase family protein [Marinitoga sp. 1135]NUU94919.1 hypothetical protein [Marinitoga sp. 1135]